MNNILIIDLDKCFECGEPKKDMHHVVPKSKGGIKTLPLCAKCHGLVHGRDFLKHRQLQREGIERAKKLKKYRGRKLGTTQTDSKTIEKHNDIVQELLIGHTVRNINELTGKSTTTVMKVRKILLNRG